EDLLELAILADEALDALVESPAFGVKIFLEGSGKLKRDGLLMGVQSARQLAQQAIALAAYHCCVDLALGLPNGDHADAQSAPRELLPGSPRGMGHELGDHVGVGDANAKVERVWKTSRSPSLLIGAAPFLGRSGFGHLVSCGIVSILECSFPEFLERSF